MSFSSLHWDILISSFQEIPWPSSNYPSWKTFRVRKCKNMENALQIKVIGKSILFCRYLRNESSNLHKIWYGGQLLSCELKFKILRRFVHKCACRSCKRARARFLMRAHIYDSYTPICARIFMKFLTYSLKIVIDYHIKFHEDSSFCGGDICKTILTFQLL